MLATGLAVLVSRWVDSVALLLVGIGLAFMAGWLLSASRLVVALVLALMFTAITIHNDSGSLEHCRTVFGSYRVFESGGRHQLAHWRTLHGTQWLDDRRDEPTTYYARSGPLGNVFTIGGFGTSVS